MAEQRTRRSGLQRRSGNLVQSAAAGLHNITARAQVPQLRPGTGLRRSRRQAQRPRIITSQQESLERGRAAAARAEAQQALAERGQEFSQDIATRDVDLRESRFLEDIRFREGAEGRAERAADLAERSSGRADEQLGLSRAAGARAGLALDLQIDQGGRAERALAGQEASRLTRDDLAVAGFESAQEQQGIQNRRQAEIDQLRQAQAEQGLVQGTQQIQKGEIELDAARKQAASGRTGLRRGAAGKSAIETTPNLLISRGAKAAGLRADQFRVDGELTREGEIYLESLREMEADGIDIRDPRAIQIAIQDAGFQTDEQQEVKIEANLETMEEDDPRRAVEERKLQNIRERGEREEAAKEITRTKASDKLVNDPVAFRAQLDDMAFKVSPESNKPGNVDRTLKTIEDKLEKGDFDKDEELRIDTYDALIFPITEGQGLNMGEAIRRENFKSNAAWMNAIKKETDDRLFRRLGFSRDSIDMAFEHLAGQFPNHQISAPQPAPPDRIFTQHDAASNEDPRDPAFNETPVSREGAITALAKQRGISRSRAATEYRNALLRGFKSQNFEADVRKAREQFKLGKTQSSILLKMEGDEAAERRLSGIK